MIFQLYNPGEILGVGKAAFFRGGGNRHAGSDEISGVFQPQVSDVRHGGFVVILLEQLSEAGLAHGAVAADRGHTDARGAEIGVDVRNGIHKVLGQVSIHRVFVEAGKAFIEKGDEKK